MHLFQEHLSNSYVCSEKNNIQNKNEENSW